VHDLRGCARDLDPFLRRPSDLLSAHLPVLPPDLDPAGPTVEEPAGIRLVPQDAAHPDREPAPAVECRDATLVQLVADPVEAPELGVAREDAPDDLGLE